MRKILDIMVLLTISMIMTAISYGLGKLFIYLFNYLFNYANTELMTIGTIFVFCTLVVLSIAYKKEK